MTETLQEQVQDRNALKVIALRERVATLVAQYEDQDAERRVEITEKQQRIQSLEAQVADLQAQLSTPEVVEDVPTEEV